MEKNTKIKLNIIRLLIIISLVITFFSIKNTFAKYYERVNTNYEIGIKKWLVKINDTDIMEENDFSQIITPSYVANAHANENVLVPTSKGYFDMEIDYTNVDLSFDINFTIEAIGQEAKKLKDLKLSSISLIDNGVETESQLPYIVEIENENQEERIINLRVYFEWYDGENEIMNDETDSTYVGEIQTGNNHTVTRYKATAVFTQHI